METTSRMDVATFPSLQSSLFFFTLMQKLFALHQTSIRSTSYLYLDSSLLEIKPVTIVSSANLTMQVLECVTVQS